MAGYNGRMQAQYRQIILGYDGGRELKKGFVEIIMNPIRMRVIQFLLLQQKGTPAQIGAELSDVPKASLYRHIKVLVDAGILKVAEENPVRGTVEKTYVLEENPMGECGLEDTAALVSNTLLSIMGEFGRYFAGEDLDPVRDLVSLTTSTLLMTDEEFRVFLGKMGELYNEVICNKPEEGRKARRVTFISFPCRETP